jgi:hypothetical protein
VSKKKGSKKCIVCQNTEARRVLLVGCVETYLCQAHTTELQQMELATFALKFSIIEAWLNTHGFELVQKSSKNNQDVVTLIVSSPHSIKYN